MSRMPDEGRDARAEDDPDEDSDKPDDVQSQTAVALPTRASQRYPDHLMPLVGGQQEREERIADAIEAFLLNYGYNTARAYRADLEDILLWTDQRGLDLFALADGEFRRYVAVMRRRRYSEATIRRRGTAYRGFIRSTSGS